MFLSNFCPFLMNSLKMLPRLKFKISSSVKLQCYQHTISNIEPITKYIKIDGTGNSVPTREIAYKQTDGINDTKLVYIPGFMSDKSGNKAQAIGSLCHKHGLNYIRYDPTGLGESRPLPLKAARFSHWLVDAERILDIGRGPQIVVASSMGGWIALRLCLKHPEKFKALILLAPGINFVQRYYAKILQLLPKETIQRLEKGETIGFEYGQYGSFPVSYDLMNNMTQYELDLTQPLEVSCPVRIIHGLKDEDVPFRESLHLLENLQSKDVHLTYVKDGDHRLSRDEDLELIGRTILDLIQR